MNDVKTFTHISIFILLWLFLLLFVLNPLNRAGNDCRVRAFQTLIESSQLPVAWSKWKRDLESYFEAENITLQSEKRAKLLYLGGTDLRDIYDNLPDVGHVSHVLLDPPYYDAAIAKLDAYFEPFRRRTYEQYQFRQIAQKPSERFSDFVLRLRTQVKRCEYGQPDEMVVDQIVERCRSDKLRQKLLKRDMFLDEVEALGTILEESERQMKEFKTHTFSNNDYSNSDTINRLAYRQTISGVSRKPFSGFRKPYLPSNTRFESPGGMRPFARSEPVCFACGKRGHVKGTETCPAIHAICMKCRGKGHFARQCLKRPNMNERGSGPNPVKRIRVIEENVEEDKESDGYIFMQWGKIRSFSRSVESMCQ